MEIDTSEETLPILKALSNESRLKIINLLAHGEHNIKQIAKKLYLSNSIVTRHINQLEEAGFIATEFVSTNTGRNKVCRLAIDELYVRFPGNVFPQYKAHTSFIPVGHYTDYHATPTCGLATKNNYIGNLDDPKYFMDINRMDAEIVWLTEGFLEYKIPNLLNNKKQKPELLEISLELASEFPVSNNNWPSDIGFYINDIYIGKWKAPGNFSDKRGRITPEWWPNQNSQYGLLKNIRVTPYETLIDGKFMSNINLRDLKLHKDLIKIKIAVEKNNEQGHGLTIFGKYFGNHPQHIIYKMYYSDI